MPARGVAALCVLMLALGACGSEDPPSVSDDQAREQAAAAEAAVEELRETTDALEDRIAELEQDRSRLESRLGAVTERVWKSLGNVRTSLGDAREDSDSALSQV